ncbi:hypothetical protein [Streptomyces achromogenes]|uniref:hypothetical protein n=1 Tax=Streptomyces achromogenes TaxID=67255 RepID=UPI003701614B
MKQEAYARAVRAADRGLSLQLSGANTVTGTTVGSATALTLMPALVASLGSLLGVPLGIAAHRMVVPRMAAGLDITLPGSMTAVWHPPLLAVLALAGVVIAVVGALVPARRAARLTVAEVLRNE